MEIQIYKAEIDPSLDSDLEVTYIGLVAMPAIKKNFLMFKKEEGKIRLTFNEEKRIISGPAMIADMPLFRENDRLGKFYVVFDKQAIQSIAEKFAAKGYLKNFNLFHDPLQKVSDVVIFNSFISDKEIGISPMSGFEDLPDGSWFISAKVNNEDTWNRIKAGEIKGFSVEGLFGYLPMKKNKMTTEEAYEKIQAILNETEFN